MGRPARVTRTQVLKAAREAFAAGGYDGTTLATIAGRLGLSPAALLRHAPSKAALFAAAMAEPPAAERPFPMAFMAEADPARPREVLRELARTAIPFIEAQISEAIACWMYAKNARERSTGAPSTEAAKRRARPSATAVPRAAVPRAAAVRFEASQPSRRAQQRALPR